ncbi:conserved Plasmodium protein, unknown function [Plasmodium gallinaceum]|uniref:Uncharacterized protein n=1 Tax=Plasmodium gallinaceum TaxID=5849 RepID=A0A1J1GQG7_PLAGA|nr:conserved Plasmodium protein, unknown function [Plasmodium gallinaceum]CRG94691.1 conserved Plasmodium protein, unknown function [Plasmodium gallinaceum]
MASSTLKNVKVPEKKAAIKNLKIDINNNEEYKKLKEDKKKLKKELSIKETEINNLKKILEDKENDIKLNYIPLKEARKITFKALRKGSAAQKFISLIESNSINYKLKKKAINILLTNAYGVLHHQKNRYSDVLKYTDSHLKLFRQEQLILLAENERLTMQMKELKKQLLDNKIENIKKNEKNLITPMKRNTESIEKKNNNTDDNFVELDADIVEKNFINLIKNIKIAQLKLLFFAFRKLSNNVYNNVDPTNVSANMINSLKHGMDILNNILKNKKTVITCNAFYKLLNCNINNLLYKSKYLQKINKYSSCNYSNPKNGQRISHFVYKPYYYDNLPSATCDVQKKRLPILNDKKDLFMKDLIHKGEPLYEPFTYENVRNNISKNKYYKKDYFDMEVKKNFDSEKYSCFNDFDFLSDFSAYDKEKFIDLFITETTKK